MFTCIWDRLHQACIKGIHALCSRRRRSLPCMRALPRAVRLFVLDECLPCPPGMRRTSAVWYDWTLHLQTDAAYTSLVGESAMSNVHYVSSTWTYARLCDANTNTCGASVPGVPQTIAWYDRHHLSTAGSLYLAPFLHCFLTDRGLLG